MTRLILPLLLSSLVLGPVSAQPSPVVAQAPATTAAPAVNSLNRILNSVVSISTVQPPGPAGPSSRGWSPFPGTLLPWLGSGTGVLISEQEILTSARLVQGNATVTVTARGGGSVPARVVGINPERDLALLRLERRPAAPLRAAPLGNSDRLTQGQRLIAVGLSPSGGFTAQEVTVRSAAARDELTLDTALNAMARGGPLINSAGEVVGLVSGRFGPRLDLPFNAGVQGAAVPINSATSVLADLRAGRPSTSGPVQPAEPPARLGVRVVDLAQLPADQKHAMKWPASGLLVQDVTPGSPADRAGVRAGHHQQRVGNETVRVGGDVIVSMDGQPVRRFDEFRQTLATKAAGSTVTLEVLRNNQSQRLTVTLDPPPAR
ncbi:trypsin-like peptidase domain-containing protein [Deinococcus deserti]|nr:trypsin-like peptidase domain-containing protein [Deinococcus deserti]